MGPNELRQRAAESVRRAREIREAGGDLAEADALLASAEADVSNADRLDGEERQRNEADAARRQREARLGQALGEADRRGTNDLNRPPQGDREARDRGERLARYSLLDACRRSFDGGVFNPGRIAGVEAEFHQEARAANPHRASLGFHMPLDLPIDLRAARRAAEMYGREKRTFDTIAGVGMLLETTSTTLIDYLRARSVMSRMGARIITGLVGVVDFPKKTGVSQAYWVSQGNAPSPSNATVGQIQYTPRTVGAYTEITRKLMMQTSFDAEMLTRMDLAESLALEIDRAGVNGSGIGQEPEGILQNPSVATVALGTNGDAPSWAKMVEMETVVENANALMDESACGYLFTPKAKGKLKTVSVDTGSGRFIWDIFFSSNTINGYRAMSSTQLPSNMTKGSGSNLSTGIFGDFSQSMYGFWSDPEIMLNPYALDTSGGVRISILQDADFHLRHAEAFSKVLDMVTN